MSNLSVSIPHQLGRAEAKRRIEDEARKYSSQQGALPGTFQERWEGDTMHFTAGVLGQSITGQLAVEDQCVRLDVVLPWLLQMLASSVQQRIEQQGRLLLGGPKAK